MKYTQQQILQLKAIVKPKGDEEERLFQAILGGDADNAFLKAVVSGDAKSQGVKGIDYFEERNYAKAFFLCKIANNKDLDARVYLAIMYNYGRGITEDKAKAIPLFKAAEEKGVLIAQVELGKLYKTGVKGIIQQNITQAHSYFESAANQGHPEGQYCLAILLHEKQPDLSKNPDRDQILELLKLAKAKGHLPASAQLETFKQELSQNSQQTIAQTLAHLEKQAALQAALKETEKKTTQAETQSEPVDQAKELERLAVEKRVQAKRERDQKKQAENSQEAEERPNERALLSNSLPITERKLEKIKQDVEKSRNDKPVFQEKIIESIKTSINTLTEKTKFDKNGYKKRSRYLNNIQGSIDELNKLYEDIKIDESSALAAAEHLLLLSQLCSELLTPLKDSQRAPLEKLKALGIAENKAESEGTTLETFLEAEAVLSSTLKTDAEKDAMLKKLRLSLEREFGLVQQKYNTLSECMRKLQDKGKTLQTLASETLVLREGALEPNLKDKETIKDINDKVKLWETTIGKTISSGVKPAAQTILPKRKVKTTPMLMVPSLKIHSQPEIKSTSEPSSELQSSIPPLASPASQLQRVVNIVAPAAESDAEDEEEQRKKAAIASWQKITEQEIAQEMATGKFQRPPARKPPETQASIPQDTMLKIHFEQLNVIIDELNPPLTSENKYALLCSLAQVSEIIFKERKVPAIATVAQRIRNAIFKQHETILKEISDTDLLDMAEAWATFLKKDHTSEILNVKKVMENVKANSNALQIIYDLGGPLKETKDDDKPAFDIKKSIAMIKKMAECYWKPAAQQGSDQMINAEKKFYFAIMGSEIKAIEEATKENLDKHFKGETLKRVKMHIPAIKMIGMYVRHPKEELPAELQVFLEPSPPPRSSSSAPTARPIITSTSSSSSSPSSSVFDPSSSSSSSSAASSSSIIGSSSISVPEISPEATEEKFFEDVPDDDAEDPETRIAIKLSNQQLGEDYDRQLGKTIQLSKLPLAASPKREQKIEEKGEQAQEKHPPPSPRPVQTSARNSIVAPQTPSNLPSSSSSSSALEERSKVPSFGNLKTPTQGTETKELPDSTSSIPSVSTSTIATTPTSSTTSHNSPVPTRTSNSLAEQLSSTTHSLKDATPVSIQRQQPPDSPSLHFDSSHHSANGSSPSNENKTKKKKPRRKPYWR